jgi:hypothetical protein
LRIIELKSFVRPNERYNLSWFFWRSAVTLAATHSAAVLMSFHWCFGADDVGDRISSNTSHSREKLDWKLALTHTVRLVQMAALNFREAPLRPTKHAGEMTHAPERHAAHVTIGSDGCQGIQCDKDRRFVSLSGDGATHLGKSGKPLTWHLDTRRNVDETPR